MILKGEAFQVFCPMRVAPGRIVLRGNRLKAEFHGVLRSRHRHGGPGRKGCAFRISRNPPCAERGKILKGEAF